MDQQQDKGKCLGVARPASYTTAGTQVCALLILVLSGQMIGAESHAADSAALTGGACSLHILEPVLEHIVSHLVDLRNLRLTSKAFRYHPAVLQDCRYSRIDDSLTMQQFRAAMAFLQRLPYLDRLFLNKPKTLLGVHLLTQLEYLEISNHQSLSLDMSALAPLQYLQDLTLEDCKAQELMNLSELTGLTRLQLSEPNVSTDIAALKDLQVLDIWADLSSSELKDNGNVYKSLSMLTVLADNAMGHNSWVGLPKLHFLSVYSISDTLIGISFPPSLRVLSLYTGNSEAVTLTYFAPLAALTQLARLGVQGRIPPIPSLPRLTVLCLDFERPIDRVPDLASFPQLLELRLSLCGDLVLPRLADHPSLCRIYHLCLTHSLSMDIRDHGKCRCEARSSLRSIAGELGP